MADCTAIWRPLNASESEIRLLELEPNSNPKAPPRGRLVTRSLNDGVAYQAISYAWGSGQLCDVLFIDNLEVPITEHLYGALRHLRHRTQARYFWIDAISISQRDKVERAHQVTLMRRIFRGAELVNVWLGSGSEEVSDALDAIRDQARYSVASKVNLEQHASGIGILLKADFWTRLWIVQEVVLANKLVVRYGDSEFGPDVLNRDKWWNIQSSWRYPVISEFRAKLWELICFNEILSKTSACSDLDKLRVLLAFCSRGRTLQVTDQRDRVFALLGLCVSYFGIGFISPDYTLQPTQVYTDFAWKSIQQTESLLIVTQAVPCQSVQASLPSWAPDWSSSFDDASQSQYLAKWNVFRASNSFPTGNIRLSSDGKLLRVRGVICDQVDGTSELCPRFSKTPSYPNQWPHLDQLSVIKQWSKLWLSSMIAHSKQGKPHKRDIFDGFHRTVMEDIDCWKRERVGTPYQHVIAPYEEFIRLEDYDLAKLYVSFLGIRGWEGHPDWPDFVGEVDLFYRKVLFQPALMPPNIRHYSALLAHRLADRRFFVSKKGLPGLGPTDTQKGDVIAVLAGGNMPFVLRKVSVVNRKNTYTVVGPCYLDSIMDGEVFERLDVADLEKIWLA